MSVVILAKLAHILGFVYWLGGDLGTFFGSKYVIDPTKSPEARALALKIMMACDQAPKIAMPFMLVIGLSMAKMVGLVEISLLVEALLWAVAIVWCFNVNYLYFSSNVRLKAMVTRMDFGLRVMAVMATVGYALAGLCGVMTMQADWLAYKMLIFAAMVVFGLMVRVLLKSFPGDFRQLMIEGASTEVNARITRQMKLAKSWVWGIWVGLFVNAMIGVHLLNGSMMLVVVVCLVPLPLMYWASRRYQ